MPSLAGNGVTYLREVLDQFYFYERHCSTTSYRYGDRPKTPMNMCNVANTLSDEDKQAVAEYFADQ
jgi:cytochrome c553